ncbi:TPA: glycosyltransferase family 4 protein [Vibrio parahaemolyticus]|uniref:Alpha-maltose-1-phosphate synthase n=1 Tax=Vibrio parahaemolyticus TaxID=670 RepID=A0A7M1W9S0_VIBPH|nr:glycosyltransferase family 1 protein [Vibrio parahaemolyticus]EGQ8008513.1 glycosyltransferase family 4 protein [Vibrio parahaemolyticus]EHH1043486.1 glycosyltransferase family 4 protein [Vibrio parahaemolyticus]EHK2864899.1 glycosyltransferase family 4 protein [Vibrio parahaemolyticus]EHK2867544.1 glycosyltransferase family 4 protein [Vibrio parahaemolyticus]EHK9099131.1 glycosyltransferase family 4 protein [Vibrio parahaemolyticus]
MIVYDGIINHIQSHGGVSVLFHELNKRMKLGESKYFTYGDGSELKNNATKLSPRLFERYRKFNVSLSSDDIFHSTYYRLPTAKCKVVTTVHDFTYEKYVSGLARKVHSFQKNNAIMNSDKIICVSHNTAKDLLKYCPVSESKIEVVYNGVSEDYYPLNLNNDNYVVFVGSRAKYKNFNMTVDAVRRVRDVKIIIVGGGKLTDKESDFLDKNLAGRYEVKGFLSNSELNLIYNKALALVYPSQYEGFGIPVLEAMRASCPVIALNCSSIPEVAGDAAILLERANAAELSEAISMLMNNKYRHEIIVAGLQNAKRFSWDNCCTETKKIYESL